MLVQFYSDDNGNYIEDAIIAEPLKVGEPIVLHDGKQYTVSHVLNLMVHFQHNSVFVPVIVRKVIA